MALINFNWMLLIVTDRFLGYSDQMAVDSSRSPLLSHISEFHCMLPILRMTGMLQLKHLELDSIISTTQ